MNNEKTARYEMPIWYKLKDHLIEIISHDDDDLTKKAASKIIVEIRQHIELLQIEVEKQVGDVVESSCYSCEVVNNRNQESKKADYELLNAMRFVNFGLRQEED